jgi:hypothetical protein
MFRQRRGYVGDMNLWGPDHWRVAHCLTFLYPDTSPSEEDVSVVLTFFSIFSKLLPCAACGVHFEDEMRQSPLTHVVLQSRDTLSRWLHAIHNRVNARKGKPQVLYADVLRYYTTDASALQLAASSAYVAPSPRATRGAVVVAVISALALGVAAGVGVSAAVRRRAR